MRALIALNALSGGATLSAIEAMEALAKRGHRFVVVAPSSDGEHRARLARVADEIVAIYLPWWNKKIRAKTWKRPLISALESWKSGAHVGSLAQLVRLIRRTRVDVVHTNTSVTWEPAFAARIVGVPHVWHIREAIGAHDLYRFWLPDAALARTFLALADSVLVNSRTARALFDRAGHGDDVRVVYNGIALGDPAAARVRGRELRRAWGFPDDALVIGMVGHLSSEMKRHDVFVRACASVMRSRADAKLYGVVIGNRPPTATGYAADVVALVDDENARGLGGRLRLVGPVNDVEAAMSTLDILVHPSEGESFGRVAVEAMAASVPVVAAGAGGLTEIVVDGETGFFAAPRDVAATAEQIAKLVDDADLRARFGVAGRARAETAFSLDATADAIEAAYRDAVAVHAKTPVARAERRAT